MICEWFCQSEGDSDDETDRERKALRRVRMCSGLFGSVRARSSPGEQHGRWSSCPADLSLSAVADCTAPAFCWGVLCVGVSTVVEVAWEEVGGYPQGAAPSAPMGHLPQRGRSGVCPRLRGGDFVFGGAGDPHPSPLPEGEGIGGEGARVQAKPGMTNSGRGERGLGDGARDPRCLRHLPLQEGEGIGGERGEIAAATPACAGATLLLAGEGI